MFGLYSWILTSCIVAYTWYMLHYVFWIILFFHFLMCFQLYIFYILLLCPWFSSDIHFNYFYCLFAIYFIDFWYLCFCGDILLNYSFYNIVLRCILVFPHVFMSYTWYILQCSYNSLEMLHGVYYVVHIVLIGLATMHFQFFTQYHEFFLCCVWARLFPCIAHLIVPFFIDIFILVCWSIWMARNCVIFRNLNPTIEDYRRCLTAELFLLLPRAKISSPHRFSVICNFFYLFHFLLCLLNTPALLGSVL